MKKGFTGTQRGMSGAQQYMLKRLLADCSELHHGDCVGSDAQAHDIAYSVGVGAIVIHPPVESGKRAWKSRGFHGHSWELQPKPYLDRDRDIVDQTDMLIATPKEPSEPSNKRAGGTWYTIRYARKQGKLITIVFPSGDMRIEGGK